MSIISLREPRRKPTPFAHGLIGPRVLATLPLRGEPHAVVSLTEHDLPAAQGDPSERHCWHVRAYAEGREIWRLGFDALRDAQSYLASLTSPLPPYDDPALDDDLAWSDDADRIFAAAARGFSPEGGGA